MRTDILDFHEFYGSPLGAVTREFVGARLGEVWSDGAGLSIAGFGFANPYLAQFEAAQRRLALAPGGQGVIRWPAEGRNSASLVGECAWPLPDASLDRVLIVHGLEESPAPQRLMREIWRVLADDGRVIIVASHRRGLWSMFETTPFAAGRPYLKRQLDALLGGSMFRAVAWSRALFFPPFRPRFLLRGARAWERAGARLWPGFAGVLMVEAAKDVMAPVGLIRQARAGARRPAIAAPSPVRMEGARMEGPAALDGKDCGGYRRGRFDGTAK